MTGHHERRRKSDRAVRLLVIGYVFLTVGIAGAFYSFQDFRAEQIARLREASCDHFDTLHRFIAEQPPPNRPFYRRLGFTDAQIDEIASAVKGSKAANLRLLGVRDPTCPKEKP